MIVKGQLVLDGFNYEVIEGKVGPMVNGEPAGEMTPVKTLVFKDNKSALELRIVFQLEDWEVFKANIDGRVLIAAHSLPL